MLLKVVKRLIGESRNATLVRVPDADILRKAIEKFRQRTTVGAVMTIFAFITLKSSSTPLMESLCGSNPCGFELSVLCSHLLLFRKKTYIDRKKAVSPRSHPAAQQYTRVVI